MFFKKEKALICECAGQRFSFDRVPGGARF